MMYCEFCYEDNLKTYYESDLRPFDIYCSKNCVENLVEEILNGEWDSHFNDNDKYKNELKTELKNKNWFNKNCKEINERKGNRWKELN